MTWLAWRQMRGQALAAAIGMAALALLLMILVARTGHLAVADVVRQLSLPQKRVFALGSAALNLLPAVLGVFWGAPLVARELEAGTHRLAWAQGVGRQRWLWTKVGLGALATVATVGVASLALTWWAAPVDQAIGLAGDDGGVFVAKVEPLVFDARGIVPVAHALLAFMSGVAAGTLLRRTLPAMGATLVVVVALSLAMPLGVRQHLIAPVATTEAITADTPLMIDQNGTVTVDARRPGSWVLDQTIVDRSGARASAPAAFLDCLNHRGAPETCNATLRRAGLHVAVREQPARRFWPLQWIESGIFLALSAALAAFCALWIRRI
jgi:hypothetical protein